MVQPFERDSLHVHSGAFFHHRCGQFGKTETMRDGSGSYQWLFQFSCWELLELVNISGCGRPTLQFSIELFGVSQEPQRWERRRRWKWEQQKNGARDYRTTCSSWYTAEMASILGWLFAWSLADSSITWDRPVLGCIHLFAVWWFADGRCSHPGQVPQLLERFRKRIDWIRRWVMYGYVM